MIANDGYKIYTQLIEYSTLTGLPTGRVKPNVPSDPNYLAPVLDASSCPIGPIPSNQNIQVIIPFGYVVEVKIFYGAATLTRTTSGVWVVPSRTYDNVIFSVTNMGGSDSYTMRVVYNGGVDVVEVSSNVIGSMLFPGPFPGITILEIIPFPELGAYSDSFSDSYDV